MVGMYFCLHVVYFVLFLRYLFEKNRNLVSGDSQTVTQMGCLCCNWWLYLLCHNANSSVCVCAWASPLPPSLHLSLPQSPKWGLWIPWHWHGDTWVFVLRSCWWTQCNAFWDQSSHQPAALSESEYFWSAFVRNSIFSFSSWSMFSVLELCLKFTSWYPKVPNCLKNMELLLQ